MRDTIIPFRPAHAISDDELVELTRRNPELRLERTPEGALIISPPTGGDTGSRNTELTRQLANWNREAGHGKAFDSSTGFKLPNGAVYSPDASWLRLARWTALSAEERKGYVPLSPDLAMELLSASDDFRAVPPKLRDYIDCGTHVALLLDPYARRVLVHPRGGEPVALSDPERVDLAPYGDDFRGLVLNVRDIFDA